MSEHRVLDYNTPIDPGDITVGNVVLLHGQPRTIQHVNPHRPYGRLLTPTVEADLGHGDRQTFYIVTCQACTMSQAFPGLGSPLMADWYGLSHGNEYRLYCSQPCVTKGIADGR